VIAEGPIIQVAWVVDEIEATEKLLGEQFGAGGWTRMPDVSRAGRSAARVDDGR
jgi:hypothetical protein